MCLRFHVTFSRRDHPLSGCAARSETPCTFEVAHATFASRPCSRSSVDKSRSNFEKAVGEESGMHCTEEIPLVGDGTNGRMVGSAFLAREKQEREREKGEFPRRGCEEGVANAMANSRARTDEISDHGNGLCAML